MCGRYSFSKPDIHSLLKRFDLIDAPSSLSANYNITPLSEVPVILNESPRRLSLVRWGLIPSWFKADKINAGFINARAETIAEKPAFKNSFRSKRCLILADSFYEWKKVGGKKHPFRIMLQSGEVFAFAGIWDIWRDTTQEIRSCSIITTTPNETVRGIHERMPVILPKAKEKLWLSDLPLNDCLSLLTPYADGLMQSYEVSTRINSPGNNDPQILEPLTTG